MRSVIIRFSLAAAAGIMSCVCLGQSLPATPGETLSGKHIVLADAVRGHSAILVAGFSREGGAATGEWIKRIRADNAFGGVTVYQVAMIAGAPGFVRGMIRSGMKKGTPPAEQDFFVVLVADQKLWENYFGVSTDKDPYVVLMDGSGKILWHGHGPAANLEPQLKAALR
jgi:hypothetical protein